LALDPCIESNVCGKCLF